MVRRQLARAAHMHTALLRALAAFACARPDQAPLKLCEASEHGSINLPCGVVVSHPRFVPRSKGGAAFAR